MNTAKIAAILLLAALAWSCSSFSSRTVPAAKAPPPTPQAEKAAAPRTEDLVLRELPPRVRDFLAELRTRLVAGDLVWVVSRAEPAHRDRYAVRRGMDDASYLALLLDIGGSYARGETPLAPEPRSFDLRRLAAMRYLSAGREGFSWIVKGVMTDRRGTGIDFTLDVLGELETILLAGK